MDDFNEWFSGKGKSGILTVKNAEGTGIKGGRNEYFGVIILAMSRVSKNNWSNKEFRRRM